MIREVIQEAKTYTLKYQTTPNGHFGGSKQITQKQFDAIKDISTPPFTENGFNMWKEGKGSLEIGYNHYIHIKDIVN